MTEWPRTSAPSGARARGRRIENHSSQFLRAFAWRRPQEAQKACCLIRLAATRNGGLKLARAVRRTQQLASARSHPLKKRPQIYSALAAAGVGGGQVLACYTIVRQMFAARLKAVRPTTAASVSCRLRDGPVSLAALSARRGAAGCAPANPIPAFGTSTSGVYIFRLSRCRERPAQPVSRARRAHTRARSARAPRAKTATLPPCADVRAACARPATARRSTQGGQPRADARAASTLDTF
jgi:hypothetical protein